MERTSWPGSSQHRRALGLGEALGTDLDGREISSDGTSNRFWLWMCAGRLGLCGHTGFPQEPLGVAFLLERNGLPQHSVISAVCTWVRHLKLDEELDQLSRTCRNTGNSFLAQE